MRKISAFKNDAWKIERVLKTFENLNSFLDDVENAKNDANILKTYFFLDFHCFSLFFGFSENFIKKMGQKMDNNRCPLFTMLTKPNSSMFCIVSFVKKRKRKWSHYLGQPAPFEEKWYIFRGDQPTNSHWSIVTGDLPPQTHTGLFSQATYLHTLIVVYFQGRPPTHTYPGLFCGRTVRVEKTKSGLFVMGDLSRWKNGLIVMGDLPR